jgi:phospholipid/cholesterol/gamma-HCH transport system substrate-binding protein
MSAEAHKFKVGLFVIGGIILLAGGLIWLGASKFLSETRTYATYFDETVQGLDIGSQVKFMGVLVGAVSKIKIAPDGKMVEVLMEIGSNFKREKDMVIELTMAGITGMKYVEIKRDPKYEPPPLSFPTDPNYIPARLSGIGDIMNKVDQVYKKVMEIDFSGISEETKGALKAVGARVDDPKVDRLLEGMAGAAERLRYLLSKKQTENTIDEIEATLGELKLLVKNIRGEVEGMDLKGTFAQLRETVFNLNQVIERVDNELSETLINMRRTTDNLARVTEKVSQDPAQTILGEPPPERVVPDEEGR